jgi:tight adherence protein C
MSASAALLLPVGLVAVGVLLLAAALGSWPDPARRRVERNLRRSHALAAGVAAIAASPSVPSRRAATRSTAWLRRRAGTERLAAVRRRLDRAGLGGTTTPEAFIAQKVGLAVTGTVLAAAALAGGVGGPAALVAVTMPVLLFLLPDVRIGSRTSERQRAIVLSLAETLDLMTITVEAGVAFEASMVRAAQSQTGPLAEELTRTMQEMQVGVPRVKALRDLAARCDVEDLTTFVAAVVQAERYGVPITRVLRVQSAELREKRRQRAEEAAMKIPAKVILPLAVCILPAMMLLVVGPAILQIVRSFAQL